MTFHKNSHGKWETDGCCFSLTHSGDVVAVAVSKQTVGVDIEPLSNKKTATMLKVLTPREKEEYFQLPEDERDRFLVEKWTRKESVFKTQDLSRFRPETIDVASFSCDGRILSIDGNGYVLSVSAKDLSSVRYYYNVTL